MDFTSIPFIGKRISVICRRCKIRAPELAEIALGMILGDASIYKVSQHAYIKFEQGYKQADFVEHLFVLFRQYCFMERPGVRFIDLKTPKSLWFKTFSHPSFTALWYLCCSKGKKYIAPQLIASNPLFTARTLAYWIMCDGSLDKNGKSMILHTQSFTKSENERICQELFIRFHLRSKVKIHKHTYYVVAIEPRDSMILADLIKPYLLPSMCYKLPHK